MKEYIEREAAIQALGDEPETWSEHDPVEIQEQNDWNYYKHCIEAVPAADVVEVRHGRWEMAPCNGVCDIRCSSCGYCPGIGFYSPNYCPNCGARMDKEDEHENQS